MASTTRRLPGQSKIWKQPTLGFGQLLEITVPLPIRAIVPVSFGDGALSATGTGTADFVGLEIQSDGALSATGAGTASFTGNAINDASLSSTGTGTALFVGEYSFNGIALHRSFERGAKQSLGRGPQVEFQMPLPLIRSTLVSFGDGALSTTGTGVATFAGESTADATLSATGTGTATFTADATADGVLSSTGTATVSFAALANLDGALSATGSGVATFVGEYSFNGISLYRSFERGGKQSLGRGPQVEFQTPLTLRQPAAQEGTLSATGTGDALFIGAADTDGALSATGTGTAAFVGASDAAVVTPPEVTTAGGAGGFPGAWGKPRRRRKKQEALRELDQLLDAVSKEIAPWSKAKAYEAEQALYREVLERGKRLDASDTLARIEAEIAIVQELLAEIDDEEALLLMMV